MVEFVAAGYCVSMCIVRAAKRVSVYLWKPVNERTFKKNRWDNWSALSERLIVLACEYEECF